MNCKIWKTHILGGMAQIPLDPLSLLWAASVLLASNFVMVVYLFLWAYFANCTLLTCWLGLNCECIHNCGGVMELPLLFFPLFLPSPSFLSIILPGWRWPSVAGCHSTGCARLYPLLVDILHCTVCVSLLSPPLELAPSLNGYAMLLFCMWVSKWSFLFFCFCSILLSPSFFQSLQ